MHMQIVWGLIAAFIAGVHLYISTDKYCKKLKNAKKLTKEKKN